MSGQKSPFARVWDNDRSEASPLLSEGSDNSRNSPVINKKAARHKQSFPLVYTEFRSPDPVRHNPLLSADDEGNCDDHVTRETVKDVSHWNKHSPITNLETLNSGMIWLLLLLPITLGCIAYISTIGWRYRTHEITGYMSNNTEAQMYTFPSIPARMQFIRPVLLLDGINCKGDECLNYNVHVEGLIQSNFNVPSSEEYNLIEYNVSIANFVRSYMSRKSHDIVHTNKNIFVPLPMLYLDYPMLTRDILQQKLVFRVIFPNNKVQPTNSSRLRNSGRRELVQFESKQQINARSVSHSETAGTTEEDRVTEVGSKSVVLDMLAYSDAFTMTVIIIQLALSFMSLLFLVQFFREVYSNACSLQNRFISLEGTSASRESYYGAIDSVEFIDPDAYRVKWWHFVLPEQYTSVFLLFFLCIWQGGMPSLCGLLCDAGVSVSDYWLFAAGLTVSLAQFGILFCCTVYIDGLKYHNSEIRLPRAKNNRRNSSVSSKRKNYDPFEDASHTRCSGPDESDPEYWRRGSLGLRGYTSNHSNLNSEFLTPLEKEYKKAMSVFLTYHHPSSREFLGFIYGKFIFLVVTWIVVVVYWLLMYPRIWHNAGLSSIQIVNIEDRVWLVEIALVMVAVVWFYLLIHKS